MALSFLFYDLETSGVDPRSSRIMQFAAQRTDMDLKPMGDPYNILIKLTEDILPDPDAVLITGITPQKTLSEGVTEAEFCKLFVEEIAAPDTVFVGFNSIRFDDEFIRFLLWRNFHDPYSWQYRDGRSRWDILDLARMTRALRPDGIKWPFDTEGKPTNRLEFLTNVNKLDHQAAHDALSDVKATIAVAGLIYERQPKLFAYSLSLRDKKKVAQLATKGEPFVYTSGRYQVEYEKTTVVTPVVMLPENQGLLVYDLRHNPQEYLSLSPEKLAELWKYDRQKKTTPLPIKTMRFNRCPAVAPMGVLDEKAQKRLGIKLETIQKHLKTLRTDTTFGKRLQEALDILNNSRAEQTALIADERLVDAQLYDGFLAESDRRNLEKVRSSSADKLSGLTQEFSDERLKKLLNLYKARNYSPALSDEERAQWEEYRKKVLLGGGEQSRLTKFSKRLMELGNQPHLTDEQRYLLEELRLYAESILPEL